MLFGFHLYLTKKSKKVDFIIRFEIIIAQYSYRSLTFLRNRLHKGMIYVVQRSTILIPCVPVLPVTQHQAMKAHGGVEVQLHPFFDLGIRWRWVVSFTPLPIGPSVTAFHNSYHADMCHESNLLNFTTPKYLRNTKVYPKVSGLSR